MGRGLTAAAAVVSFVCYLAILYALLANFPTTTPSPLLLFPSPSAALFTLSQLPLSLHCKLHSQLAFMFAFYASDYPGLPSHSPLSSFLAAAVTVSVAVPGEMPPSTLTNCACA